MKIRVVSVREEIFRLDANEKIIHLAFRPSNKDIFALVQQCPGIQAIQLPHSYHKSISKSILVFLEMQKVAFLKGDVWGHRKDLNDYYIVPLKMEEIVKASAGKDLAVAGQIVSKECGISVDTAMFYVKKIRSESAS